MIIIIVWLVNTQMFSEEGLVMQTPELVNHVEFVSYCYEHPLTTSGDEIGAFLVVKGSFTDQWAQCEHAHLLFLPLKHNDLPSLPPSLPLPLPSPFSLLLLILPPDICTEVGGWPSCPVAFAGPCVLYHVGKHPCGETVLTHQHPDWAKMSSHYFRHTWARLLTRHWWFLWCCCGLAIGMGGTHLWVKVMRPFNNDSPSETFPPGENAVLEALMDLVWAEKTLVRFLSFAVTFSLSHLIDCPKLLECFIYTESKKQFFPSAFTFLPFRYAFILLFSPFFPPASIMIMILLSALPIVNCTSSAGLYLSCSCFHI